MKISKLFHWLYFMVMMLPLFVVPIYFIYSQRHDLTEQTQVDIQYKYQSNIVNSLADLVEGNIYLLQKDYISFEKTGNGLSVEDLQLLSYNIHTSLNSVYCEDFYMLNYLSNNGVCYFTFFDNDYTTFSIQNGESYYQFSIDENDQDLEFSYFIFVYSPSFDSYLEYFSGINLLPQYTDYNIIESVQVEDTNASITNAFVNSFADTIDKYFNYDNALNFGDLYTWLNLTFFNNQAPLGFFIFWHLLIYWLLTSLLWLLFDVLLYVPQLCHRWLDKASLS